jgi:uncharacterized protein YutE (UPF0331/DUF86 family)
MADDVLLSKASTIERCLGRILEEYRGHEAELETNFTRQDALLLNLLRACEASIDAAMHLVRLRKLGLPQESREAFRMLEQGRVLTPDLSLRLQKMVGFRNIAVHNYASLDIAIVRAIVEERLDDFREYARLLVRLS